MLGDAHGGHVTVQNQSLHPSPPSAPPIARALSIKPKGLSESSLGLLLKVRRGCQDWLRLKRLWCRSLGLESPYQNGESLFLEMGK